MMLSEFTFSTLNVIRVCADELLVSRAMLESNNQHNVSFQGKTFRTVTTKKDPITTFGPVTSYSCEEVPQGNDKPIDLFYLDVFRRKDFNHMIVIDRGRCNSWGEWIDGAVIWFAAPSGISAAPDEMDQPLGQTDPTKQVYVAYPSCAAEIFSPLRKVFPDKIYRMPLSHIKAITTVKRPFESFGATPALALNR